VEQNLKWRVGREHHVLWDREKKKVHREMVRLQRRKAGLDIGNHSIKKGNGAGETWSQSVRPLGGPRAQKDKRKPKEKAK